MEKNDKMRAELEKIKSQVIDASLITTSLLGLIAYIISLVKFFSTGFSFQFVTDFFVLLAIILTTIYRAKLSSRVKSIVILGAILLLVFYDAEQFGMLATNKYLIVLIPFLSVLTFSYGTSFLIFSGTIAIYFGIGLLHVYGFLQNSHKLDEFLVNIRPLTIDVLIIVIVSVVIISILRTFGISFLRFYKEIEDNNISLAASERNYREIFNATSDAIFIHDLKGNVLDVNNAMLKMYHYTREEFSEINFERLIAGTDPYDIENVKIMLNNAIRTGSHRFDWLARKKEGELFWVEVDLRKTIIGGEERLLAVVRDIHEKKEMSIQLENYKNSLEQLVEERTNELSVSNKKLSKFNEDLVARKEELEDTVLMLKNMQNKLIHSEKMASLGILTAGVAHEINNPLNFIQAGIYRVDDFIKDHLQCNEIRANQEIISKILADMQLGVERVNNIVSGLNHFSHQSSSFNENCNLHAILDNCILIVFGQERKNIQIEKKLFAQSSIVLGNDGKLHHAFLNILMNAMQSIRTKGNVILESYEHSNSIVVSITDTGMGISPEYLSKIFDPFFTTKSVGEGTGLGLSISYGIIQEHKGMIDVKSKINEGTKVTVVLPK